MRGCSWEWRDSWLCKDVLRRWAVLGFGEVSSDGAVVMGAWTAHCERASWPLGPCLSPTDCRGWTHCCVCFQMPLGRVVLAVHRHSWSRSASRTHSGFLSISAQFWAEKELWEEQGVFGSVLVV